VPTLNRDNHASAINFHDHVKNFTDKEVLCKRGFKLVLYMYYLAGCAKTFRQASQQFKFLRQTLQVLGLQEATHKASLPAQSIVWLGLFFDSVSMTVSITSQNISEIT
jgi:hypothetical protein